LSVSTVQITSRGSHAQLRNPWVLVALSVVTLGIYHLCWSYFVNRGMPTTARLTRPTSACRLP
jgi:hypothetical protein